MVSAGIFTNVSLSICLCTTACVFCCGRKRHINSQRCTFPASHRMRGHVSLSVRLLEIRTIVFQILEKNSSLIFLYFWDCVRKCNSVSRASSSQRRHTLFLDKWYLKKTFPTVWKVFCIFKCSNLPRTGGRLITTVVLYRGQCSVLLKSTLRN